MTEPWLDQALMDPAYRSDGLKQNKLIEAKDIVWGQRYGQRWFEVKDMVWGQRYGLRSKIWFEVKYGSRSKICFVVKQIVRGQRYGSRSKIRLVVKNMVRGQRYGSRSKIRFKVEDMVWGQRYGQRWFQVKEMALGIIKWNNFDLTQKQMIKIFLTSF